MPQKWDGPICHISKESPRNKLLNDVTRVVTMATDTEKLLPEYVKVLKNIYIDFHKVFQYGEFASNTTK